MSLTYLSSLAALPAISLDAPLVFPLVLGVFGAAVGSFLNVVIYRLPRENLTISKPRRSFCPSCGHAISWKENIPVFSWVLQGGRCRGCKTSIPARYVTVEVLTALLFAAFGAAYVARRLAWGSDDGTSAIGQGAELFASLFLIGACVSVTFIDIDFKIIPDQITWPGMGLGVALSALAPRMHESSRGFQWAVDGWGCSAVPAALISSLAGLATGAVVVWVVGWLGTLVFRQEAMGLGDVKYMGMFGAFLGFDGVLLVFFLACLTGALGGLVHRLATGTRYIAFGPYLSLGAILVLFFREEMLQFLLADWPRVVRALFGLDSDQ